MSRAYAAFFSLITPLSTIGNWKREFEEWTDMNVVVYHDPAGGRPMRDHIRELEWRYMKPDGKFVRGAYKFHVVITTFEVVNADEDVISDVAWQYMVVDEAHRLKNNNGRALKVLRSRLSMLKRRMRLVGQEAMLAGMAPQALGMCGIWYDPFDAGVPAHATAKPTRIIKRLAELIE